MIVRLPPLHAGQQAVQRSRKRFRVLACGRRWGKSLLCLLLAVAEALNGKRVLWLAPTFQVCELAWTNAKRLLGPLGFATFREGSRTLALGAGSIVFRSAEQRDALRGDAYGFVVFDEAAFVERDVWDTIVRPMLADTRGGAIFASTPDGQNWFHDLYERGQTGDAEWESWQFPTSTNPHIDAAEIEAARAGMPSLAFLQEFEACFVSQEGARLRRDWIKRAVPPAGLRLVAGVDLAAGLKTSADWTAGVVMGRDDDGVIWIVDARRMRGGLGEIVEWVKQLAADWEPKSIAIESLFFQKWASDKLLRETELPVRPVRPDRDKVQRFAGLEVRFQNDLVRLAPGVPQWFVDELLAFPVGAHDDAVDAAAYAFMQLGSAGSSDQRLLHGGTSRWAASGLGDRRGTSPGQAQGFKSPSGQVRMIRMR